MSVVKELMEKGRTEKQVTGFRGRSGRTFRAKLRLEQNDEGKWRGEFDEEWANQAQTPPPEPESEPARAGPRRVRRPRVEIPEGPLEIVETRKEQPPAP